MTYLLKPLDSSFDRTSNLTYPFPNNIRPGCGDAMRGMRQTFMSADFNDNPTCVDWNENWFGDNSTAWPDMYKYDSSPSCDGFKANARELGLFAGCVIDAPLSDLIDCTLKTADPKNTWDLREAWPGLEGCSIKSELNEDAPAADETGEAPVPMPTEPDEDKEGVDHDHGDHEDVHGETLRLLRNEFIFL